MRTAEFPRVTLPGLAPDPDMSALVRSLVAKAEAQDAAIARNKRGMVEAMMKSGYRPYLGSVFRKPAKTKNVRHMERVAARSTKGATA